MINLEKQNKQNMVEAILEGIDNAQQDVQFIRAQGLNGEEEACAVVRANFKALYQLLIPVKKIKVGLSENKMFRNKEFKGIWEMTFYFNRFKTSEIGYDKTDVTIVYEDGFEYSRRYDIGAEDDIASICKALLMSVKFYAGLYKPSHLTDAQYAMSVDEQCKKDFLNIYYTYQLMA